MSNAAINNLTAPDNYVAASTLDPGVFCDHVNIDVNNQGIYWQLKQAPPALAGASPGLGNWGSEVFMMPGSRSLSRAGLCGARFRAAIPAASLPAGAVQALVTMELVIT